MVVLTLLIVLLLCCRRKVVPRCWSPIQKLVILIEAKIMFNSVLRACMQTFLSISIMLFFSVRQLNFSSPDGIGDIFLVVLVSTYLLGFTCWSINFLSRNKENLKKPAFKQRYDSIYQNVDYDKSGALWNIFYFLTRRIAMAIVICLLQFSLVVQVMVSDVLCTLMLAYMIKV